MNRRYAFVYTMLFALMMTFLCVNSSPLFNRTGTDSSVFVVMGRGMLNGKVMYKDLFDHKGLYLYFLNFIAAVISSKSLIGVFILECVFMVLCAWTVYLLFSRYASGRAALWGMQIFMLLAMKRNILEGGNLTEEYALLFQLVSIYLLCRDGERHSYVHMLLQGVLASMVLCLRPNMIMMWGGIAIASGADMLIRGEFRRLAGNIAAGLAGLALGIAPACAYAVLNDSVSDTLFGMFGYNMLYVRGSGFTVRSLVRNIAFTVAKADSLLVLGGVVSVLVVLRKRMFRSYYVAMLVFSGLSVSLSGRTYGHYYEYLVPFCLPAVLGLAEFICSQKEQRYAAVLLCVLGLMFCVQKPSLKPDPMLKFVEYNKPYYSEHEKVIVTGIHHAKLYNMLGVTPHIKYFYIPSNEYEVFPDARDAQAESILSGENDVIIIDHPDGTYPNVRRPQEVARVLEEQYTLLWHDQESRLSMFGRK